MKLPESLLLLWISLMAAFTWFFIISWAVDYLKQLALMLS